MASKTVIVDDLDQAPNAQTITFGFDGVTYRIDLTNKNQREFRQVMRPWIEAARETGNGKAQTQKARPKRPKASRRDPAAVRQWAKAQGMELAERGRVPNAVLQQFEAAHS